MKALIMIGLLAVVHPSAMVAADDPFAVPATEPPRPERLILKLPAAVMHRKTEGGQHEYRISGIYSASAKEEEPKNVASTYKAYVPQCLGFDLDFKLLTATFSTSRELSLSELAYATDDLAEFGGDLPYWCELEARDILPSELAGSLQYSTSTVTIDAPSGLAWFSMPDDQPLRIPLGFGGPDLGTLLIVPSTAHCMAHSRYVLRVLDGKGLLIWTDEKTLFAGVKIATSDVDKDSIHEIWIYRDDHGEEARFQIKGAFKK